MPTKEGLSAFRKQNESKIVNKKVILIGIIHISNEKKQFFWTFV